MQVSAVNGNLEEIKIKIIQAHNNRRDERTVASGEEPVRRLVRYGEIGEQAIPL